MNYKKELDKVMGQSEFVHRGVIIRVLVGGYECLGKKVKSFEEIESVISEANEKLKYSVVGSPETQGDTFNPSVR